ncbi:hypothetical protein LQ330_10295 [Stenotrophomonas maltophilia]|nr:hypothetical protein LQ332_15395 [Stenotrophomonas maltophilia]UGB51413.1 hypothetical protein LQ330_10295 [Stenotrophomonas maltophilia]
MAIGLVALSALIQELQAASTAWIAGQGYWSRGQQDATAALSRYLARGDAQDLDDARQALQVPLGDLQARLALEQAERTRKKPGRASCRAATRAPTSHAWCSRSATRATSVPSAKRARCGGRPMAT